MSNTMGRPQQIKQFIADCCVIGPEYQCRPAELYSAYFDWTEQKSIKPADICQFMVLLKKEGFQSQNRGQSAFRMGIALKGSDPNVIPDESRPVKSQFNPYYNHPAKTKLAEEIHDGVIDFALKKAGVTMIPKPIEPTKQPESSELIGLLKEAVVELRRIADILERKEEPELMELKFIRKK